MIDWLLTIDKRIVSFFSLIQNTSLISVFSDIYYLFYFFVLGFVLYVFFIEKNKRKFRKITILILIGFIVIYALKFSIKRERPESPIVKRDYSFPSSHAYLSLIHI